MTPSLPIAAIALIPLLAPMQKPPSLADSYPWKVPQPMAGKAPLLWCDRLVDPFQATIPITESRLSPGARAEMQNLLTLLADPAVPDVVARLRVPSTASARAELAGGCVLWTTALCRQPHFHSQRKALLARAETALTQASLRSDEIDVRAYALLALAYVRQASGTKHVGDDFENVYRAFRTAKPSVGLRACYELWRLAQDRGDKPNADLWKERGRQFEPYRSWNAFRQMLGES